MSILDHFLKKETNKKNKKKKPIPNLRDTRKSWDYWYPLVFGYFYRRLENREEVEDLTSKTLTAFLTTEKKVENPKAFVWQIAKNQLCIFIRQKNKALLTMSEQDMEGLSSSIDEGSLIEQKGYSENFLMKKKELLELIEKSLKDVEYQIVYQSIILEKNSTEIGQSLNLKPATVRQKLKRSVSKLKGKYQGLWDKDNADILLLPGFLQGFLPGDWNFLTPDLSGFGLSERVEKGFLKFLDLLGVSFVLHKIQLSKFKFKTPLLAVIASITILLTIFSLPATSQLKKRSILYQVFKQDTSSSSVSNDDENLSAIKFNQEISEQDQKLAQNNTETNLTTSQQPQNLQDSEFIFPTDSPLVSPENQKTSSNSLSQSSNTSSVSNPFENSVSSSQSSSNIVTTPNKVKIAPGQEDESSSSSSQSSKRQKIILTLQGKGCSALADWNEFEQFDCNLINNQFPDNPVLIRSCTQDGICKTDVKSIGRDLENRNYFLSTNWLEIKTITTEPVNSNSKIEYNITLNKLQLLQYNYETGEVVKNTVATFENSSQLDCNMRYSNSYNQDCLPYYSPEEIDALKEKNILFLITEREIDEIKANHSFDVETDELTVNIE